MLHRPLSISPLNITSPHGLQLLMLATHALISQSFPSATSNPFPFQLPSACIADASMRLPLLAMQDTQALRDVNPIHSLPVVYSS